MQEGVSSKPFLHRLNLLNDEFLDFQTKKVADAETLT